MKMIQDIRTLVAPCDFEHHTATLWKMKVLEEIPAETKIIEIDMAGTRSMDSSGLGALLSLNEALAPRRGHVRLINPSAVVTQLLELTRMHRVLVISKSPTVTSADTERPILVVEDESIIRSVAGMSLKPLGRQILFAENGHEAINIARRDRPAVIVLDYIMPLMDGTETLRRLKSDEATKDIPVIIMSANSRIAAGVHENFEGASCFVSKPFNPSALRSEVHRLIQDNLEVAA